MSSMLADDSEVTALRERLTAQLRTALKGRDANVAAALRSLLARLDQASAVPMTKDHVPVFGQSGEVPRRFLSWSDALALITEEIEEKRRAIATFDELNLGAEVERLTQQLELMQGFLREG
jgi:hypothetical protein